MGEIGERCFQALRRAETTPAFRHFFSTMSLYTLVKFHNLPENEMP